MAGIRWFFQTPSISLGFGSPEIPFDEADFVLHGLRLSYYDYPLLSITGIELTDSIQTKYIMSDLDEFSDEEAVIFTIQPGAQFILKGDILQEKIQNAIDNNTINFWMNLRTFFLIIIFSAIIGKIFVAIEKLVKKEFFYWGLFLFNIIFYIFLCNRKVLVKIKLCKLDVLPFQSITIRR